MSSDRALLAVVTAAMKYQISRADAAQAEVERLRARIAELERAAKMLTPTRCGENLLFPPERLGCGQPIMLETDCYRCADCDVPLHKDCARRHFGIPDHGSAALVSATRRAVAAERARDEAQIVTGVLIAALARIGSGDVSKLPREVAENALEQVRAIRGDQYAALAAPGGAEKGE